MKQTFHLFMLELKRTIKFLPRIAAVVFIIAAVLAVLLFAGEKSSERPVGKVTVGYYSPDDDAYVAMIINMVSEMDGVKSICVLEKAADEKDIYDGIKSKKYYGGIIFPKEYVQGIMYGNNTPARIIVPRGNNNFVFRIPKTILIFGERRKCGNSLEERGFSTCCKPLPTSTPQRARNQTPCLLERDRLGEMSGQLNCPEKRRKRNKQNETQKGE